MKKDVCDHNCFECPHPDCICEDEMTQEERAEAAARERKLAGARTSRRERERLWYKKNRERVLAYQRAYREEHRDRINATRRENYQKNREEYLAKQRIYDEKNRERRNVKQRERYHMKHPKARYYKKEDTAC